MNLFKSVSKSFSLLTQRDRKLLAVSTCIQALTSILDLTGVALIGSLSILGAQKLQGQIPQKANVSVQQILEPLSSHFPSESAFLSTLAVVAVFFFLFKSVTSLFLLRRIYRFLARRSSEISSRLASAFFQNSLLFVQNRPSQEVALALSTGVNSAIIETLGSAVILFSEIALLALLAGSLLVIDPVLTLIAVLYFAFITYLLQKRLAAMGTRAGRVRIATEIMGTATIQEAISSYREFYVGSRRGHVISKFSSIRAQGAQASVDAQWVSLVPKYTLESSLILGGGLLGLIQFLTKDATTAIGTLTLFLAAGSRVMPSILRIQGAISSIRSATGSSEITFKLIGDLNESQAESIKPLKDICNLQLDALTKFDSEIHLSAISFTYPNQSQPALSNISLAVGAGRSLAIVGPTGAGKSTLADVILGVIDPDQGYVSISNCSPFDAIKNWPGKIGYVPQSVALSNSTIRENVAIGRDKDEIDDEQVWSSLEKAHLADFVRQLPESLDAPIGERGVRLSGGQRQRLGLARALYTDPELLILDEATSALDAETEHAISEALTALSGTITLVTIAHRLATVRKADQVIYLEDGKLIASGSFDDVRNQVPRFDKQAKLLGL